MRVKELVRARLRARKFEQRRRIALPRVHGDRSGAEGYGLGIEPVASFGSGSQVPSLARQGAFHFCRT